MSETSSIKWEAAQWIERRMDEGPFDDVGFATWLAGDPRRQPAFDAMWRRLMGSDMDTALSIYNQRSASRRVYAASAAALLLVLAGGYQALPLIELSLAQPQRFAVAEGAVRIIKLADGTQLTLAGGAKIKVRYTRHARVVELTDGTIFANVAHDQARPFRIDTNRARIVDIGTSFEVSDKPAAVRVTVTEGTVQFGSHGWFEKPINLNAKQAALLDRQGLSRLADVNPDRVARWRDEWVEYKGTPLRQVIADLQSLSPVTIEIADESLASEPVSGRMRLTDPTAQLQNLAIIHAFRIHRTEDALILSKP
jgi:transmembrane sensor